eukprot:TRINITY_DN8312_c0_g1_i1.p1 TRINITY_DN8312_c0_g1~~TRINITY_DN8312_c0_g1_i1.p1  ORF type:complete len:119 (-),score=17.21 TRINITY_DN8312_c0_g1_i1:285-641(-)
MEQSNLTRQKDSRPDSRRYALIRNVSDDHLLDPCLRDALYDEPLPCFGCGYGWFFFLLGFPIPLLWYYATILYLLNYSHKNPRERPGLAACAIAALICTVAVIIVILTLVLESLLKES